VRHVEAHTRRRITICVALLPWRLIRNGRHGARWLYLRPSDRGFYLFPLFHSCSSFVVISDTKSGTARRIRNLALARSTGFKSPMGFVAICNRIAWGIRFSGKVLATWRPSRIKHLDGFGKSFRTSKPRKQIPAVKSWGGQCLSQRTSYPTERQSAA